MSSNSVRPKVYFEEYEQLHMLRLKNENDLYQYWYKSDKNFSDGIHIEVYHHVFNNKAANWFLIGFKNTSFNDFSLGIGQDIFTPANTQDSNVIEDDRPYTGLLYLTYSKVSNRFYKGRKLYTNFYLGLQGAAAMGEEVQNGVHEGIGNETAKGWSNQLGTGLMLDYDVTYMQLLPFGTHYFEPNFLAKAHVGTMYNYATTGLNFKIGHYTDTYLNIDGVANRRNFNKEKLTNDVTFLSKAKRKLIPKKIREEGREDEYLNNRMKRKWQYYFRIQTTVTYTLYDGTAEGSLIQFENNVHELPTDSEDQLVFQGEYSFVLQYGRFHAAFNRFIENDAYKHGDFFGFGEISLSLTF